MKILTALELKDTSKYMRLSDELTIDDQSADSGSEIIQSQLFFIYNRLRRLNG